MIIVGSGLCGTLIANKLKQKGIIATILEKSKNHGRLATRYNDKSTVDIGAQFFTVRSASFEGVVQGWINANLVRIWCYGFPPKNDKYPRFCVQNGMRHLVDHLAQDVEVQFNTNVKSIIETSDEFVLCTNSAEYRTDTLIITVPIPQAIPLVKDMLPPEDLKILGSIKYYPCITLIFESDSKCTVFQHKGKVVDFIASNKAKGISELNVFTLHCAPQFSLDNFDMEVSEVCKLAQSELNDFSDIVISNPQIKRWKYAQPVEPFIERLSYTIVKGKKKIIFAGDQFGNSKIEGACLSALDVVSTVIN